MFSELFVNSIAIKKNVPRGNDLASLPVVRHLATMDQVKFEKRVTFLVGENGTGKSTLLEAIAICCGFNPEGGTKNFQFSTRETHLQLWEYLQVSRGVKRERDGFFLRAESFYNVASNIDEMDELPAAAPPIIHSYGGTSLHRQSHGESFMTLVDNRFGPNSLFILDEPEAALSPAKQLRLLAALQELSQQNCQFLIATHSPILMAFPGAQIFVLSDSGIKETPYQETEHYILTKEFLNHPDRMLKALFSEE